MTDLEKAGLLIQLTELREKHTGCHGDRCQVLVWLMIAEKDFEKGRNWYFINAVTLAMAAHEEGCVILDYELSKRILIGWTND